MVEQQNVELHPNSRWNAEWNVSKDIPKTSPSPHQAIPATMFPKLLMFPVIRYITIWQCEGLSNPHKFTNRFRIPIAKVIMKLMSYVRRGNNKREFMQILFLDSFKTCFVYWWQGSMISAASPNPEKIVNNLMDMGAPQLLSQMQVKHSELETNGG